MGDPRRRSAPPDREGSVCAGGWLSRSPGLGCRLSPRQSSRHGPRPSASGPCPLLERVDPLRASPLDPGPRLRSAGPLGRVASAQRVVHALAEAEQQARGNESGRGHARPRPPAQSHGAARGVGRTFGHNRSALGPGGPRWCPEAAPSWRPPPRGGFPSAGRAPARPSSRGPCPPDACGHTEVGGVSPCRSASAHEKDSGPVPDLRRISTGRGPRRADLARKLVPLPHGVGARGGRWSDSPARAWERPAPPIRPRLGPPQTVPVRLGRSDGASARGISRRSPLPPRPRSGGGRPFAQPALAGRLGSGGGASARRDWGADSWKGKRAGPRAAPPEQIDSRAVRQPSRRPWGVSGGSAAGRSTPESSTIALPS